MSICSGDSPSCIYIYSIHAYNMDTYLPGQEFQNNSQSLYLLSGPVRTLSWRLPFPDNPNFVEANLHVSSRCPAFPSTCNLKLPASREPLFHRRERGYSSYHRRSFLFEEKPNVKYYCQQIVAFTIQHCGKDGTSCRQNSSVGKNLIIFDLQFYICELKMKFKLKNFQELYQKFLLYLLFLLSGNWKGFQGTSTNNCSRPWSTFFRVSQPSFTPFSSLEKLRCCVFTRNGSNSRDFHRSL